MTKAENIALSNKLKAFAEAHSVRVWLYEYLNVPASYWCYDTPLIECVSDNPIALAHEIGHALDHQTRPWAYKGPAIQGCYLYTTPMSRMDLEMRAWDISISLLDAFGFTDWDEFEESRAQGLRSHFNAGWSGLYYAFDSEPTIINLGTGTRR